MQPEHDRGRPGERAASNVISGDLHSVTRSECVLSDLDAMAENIRGYFVVQVVIDDAGHRRTQLYRSAGAAERAVSRARERGRTAHVSLCQLLPVGVVSSLGGAR
jgi:hypothetical protein